MKPSQLNITSILASIALSPFLNADTITFDNSKGDLDYNDPSNWATKNLPGSGDTARIGQGHKVALNTVVTKRAHACHIGIPNGPGSLTINEGGSISFDYYAALGWDDLGTLTINEGGSLTSKLLGIGAYVVNPGRGPGGVLNMNGGSLKTGVIQATSDKAVLNLSGGSITATGIRMPASNHDGVIINWDFSSGSSTIITVTGPMIELQNSEINLNLNGLKTGNYTLIDNRGNGIIDFTGKVNISGVAPGSGAKLNKAGNTPGANLILTISAVDTRPKR